MPASGKILKNKEQAKNRAAGIGDADGRLPSRVKAAEEMLKCTVCFKEIRRTTKNIEAVAHAKGLHPTFTFGQCFVGCPEPAAEAVSSSSSSSSSSSGVKIDVDFVRAEAAKKKTIAEGGVVKEKGAGKKKKKEDLSFLDSALG